MYSEYLNKSMYMYVYLAVNISVFKCCFMCKYFVYLRMSVCVCLCMFMCIYVFTNVYIYIRLYKWVDIVYIGVFVNKTI